MSNQQTNAAAKLQKLGKHIRQNWAKRHPMPSQQMEKIKQAIRLQGAQERTTEVKKPKPPELER